MSDRRGEDTPRSFWKRLGGGIAWLLRFVVRLLLVLIIGAAVGAGLYFGALYLYQQFVAPVQVHTIRLDIIATQEAQAREQAGQRLNDMQARLDTLEVQKDKDKETLSSLQAQLAVAEQAQATQVASLADLQATQSGIQAMEGGLKEVQSAMATVQVAQEEWATDLATWQTAQGAVEDTLSNVQAAQATVQAAAARLQASQAALDAALTSVQAEVARLTESAGANSQELVALGSELRGDTAPSALRRELQVVKAMELLTRGRLLLSQYNLGLAQADLEAGRALLADLQSQVPAYQADALAEIVARVDASLDNLPSSPVAAADQLDGAWAMLIQGLPAEPAATAIPETATPAAAETLPAAAGTPEATPTGTPEVAPTTTPEATVSPTATPQVAPATPQATPAATPTPAS